MLVQVRPLTGLVVDQEERDSRSIWLPFEGHGAAGAALLFARPKTLYMSLLSRLSVVRFDLRLVSVDTRAAANRWRETWERGWRTHEPEEIVALYAEGAYFRSHPFRDAQSPREYIEPTLAEEASAECEFGDPIVAGDRAAVEWRAETTLRDGGREKLAGVSLLRFDSAGLVVEQRDFWALG
jgi:SnoaL-like domain